MKRWLIALVCVVFVLIADSVEASWIWGIETTNVTSPSGVSGAPTTLFRFQDDGSLFETVGVITGGVDLDALAINSSGQFFAYQLNAAETMSTLVSINTDTLVATPIGPTIDGEIRGATFDFSGRLLVLDAATDQLLEINPNTGSIVNSVLLSLGGGSFDLFNTTDLTLRDDGTFYLSNSSEIYTLDVATGVVTFAFSDGNPNINAGLAFSPTASSETLFAYDVIGLDDDIFIMNVDSPPGLVELHNNVVAGNAGRGDLAVNVVPEPTAASLLIIGTLALLRRRRANG